MCISDSSLTDNATAIYYSGFKQPGGAVFGVCVDCSAHGQGQDNLQTIDGHDPVNFDTPSVSHWHPTITCIKSLTQNCLPDFILSNWFGSDHEAFNHDRESSGQAIWE